MKRALVTGGAGFIGSHLVELLRRESIDVAVIDDLRNGLRANLTDFPDNRFYKVDIRERASLTAALDDFKPDTVFHLAALHFIPYCNEHPEETFNVNVMGSHLLLELLADRRVPQRLFFASTAAVYPPKETAHLESDAAYPMDVYGLSKLAGETEIRLFAGTHPCAAVIGRLFNAVGTRETNPHLLPDIVKQLNAGARRIRLGNLTPKRDFVNAADMARAIYTSVKRAENGCATFNIGSGVAYSVVEVVQICEKILGEKIEIVEDLKLKRKVERQNLVASIEKIAWGIGWRPEIDLEKTLRELLRCG